MSIAKPLAAVLATAALAVLMAPAALAKGNAEAGASKAALCTACHGVNGNSANPEWPTLAGQSARYIEEQLRLFRAGHRNNAVMYPLALGGVLFVSWSGRPRQSDLRLPGAARAARRVYAQAITRLCERSTLRRSRHRHADQIA